MYPALLIGTRERGQLGYSGALRRLADAPHRLSRHGYSKSQFGPSNRFNYARKGINFDPRINQIQRCP